MNDSEARESYIQERQHMIYVMIAVRDAAQELVHAIDYESYGEEYDAWYKLSKAELAAARKLVQLRMGL